MVKLKPTAISYKDNNEDRLLREWIHSHSNYSGFVKDILKEVMKGQLNKNTDIVQVNKEENLIDLGDF